MDFPDELSRAVFVVGIPFAPVNNLKVKTKK
jgi:Rad3-related DNA helicase